MARKTVKVVQPNNIDDCVSVFEKILARNDGTCPPCP